MKRLTIAVFVLLMAFSFSLDVNAFFPTRRPHRHDTGNRAVGAPLDGGLLALLGAAGVAYYVSRKKKASK